MKSKLTQRISAGIRAQFLAGLLVLLPLTLTVIIIIFLFEKLDSILGTYLHAYLGKHYVHGLGLVILVLLIWIVGVLTTNYFGSRIVRAYEFVIKKTPILSNIFTGLKQISDSLFSTGNTSFKQVVLVHSPLYNVYSIGFLTSAELSRLKMKNRSFDMLNVFIPFSPPTSGFMTLSHVKDIIPLTMSVEDGLKLIVSIGVIHPKEYVMKNFLPPGRKRK
jgi:uncharacterized membrane protein